MGDKTIITLTVTVGLAFLGFIIKYLNDVAIARRRDRLDRINQQLKYLYGPLYATRHVSHIAWEAFRSRYRPGKRFFRSEPPPSKDELAAWRLWMTEVFMPLNLRLEKTIVENGDLIIEKEMPECFLRLCAHVAAYKPVIRKWQSGDYSEHMSMSAFPTKDLNKYIDSSYARLKNDQAALLGALKAKADA